MDRDFIYNELAEDLIVSCELTEEQAYSVVTFMKNEGILDYDTMKEYYLEDE